MISVFEAVVLGILQGLSEFLPVSSSAHLSLTPWLLGWPSPGLAFDVALHVGTLIAVVWYFRDEWLKLLQAAWQSMRTGRIETLEQKRGVFLILATIPAAVAGLMLQDLAETVFRSPLITAGALIVLGLILWIVDRAAPTERHLAHMTWRDALLIGCAQILALVPGVSRSGATMTAGRALGLSRESAASFSFLMSMPIIAAAAILKVPEVLRTEGVSAPLVAGVAASAISGFAAIAILMHYVRKNSYGIFAVYRILLGLFILGIYFTRGQ